MADKISKNISFVTAENFQILYEMVWILMTNFVANPEFLPYSSVMPVDISNIQETALSLMRLNYKWHCRLKEIHW